MSSNYLQAFEKDMNSLRRVSESLFVSVIKMIFCVNIHKDVHINEIYFQWARPRMYLHQATLRMMAGAAPNKTRQLLDRSLIQKSSSRGLICGKGEFSQLCLIKINGLAISYFIPFL